MSRYEKSDVSFAAIAKGFAGLAVLLGAAAFLSRATLRAFGGRALPAVRRPAPPEPRLQGDPVDDLRRFRAEEEAELNGYGWVDRPRGIVRVPIERAMALLLRRGLPARAASARPGS